MAIVNRGLLLRGVKEESMYGFLVCWDEKKWPLVEVQLYSIANCGCLVSLSLFTFVFSELSLLPVSEKRAQ